MIWSTKKIDLLLTAHRENIADYRSIEPLAELWLLAVPLPYNSYISWHPGGNCWRDQPCFLVNIQDMDSSESRFCWRLGFAVKAKARFFWDHHWGRSSETRLHSGKEGWPNFWIVPHELMEWSELSESLSNLPLEINMLPLYGKYK